MPITSTDASISRSFLRSVNLQFQEVCSAGNAGVVVANSLFALPCQLFLVQVEMLLNISAQVVYPSTAESGSKQGESEKAGMTEEETQQSWVGLL